MVESLVTVVDVLGTATVVTVVSVVDSTRGPSVV
jgi:hypothetical protein